MAWLNAFKLGLPCKESSFELNPTAMDYTPRVIGDFSRGLDGTGIDVNTSRNRPLVRIDGNYISPAQRNQFEAMLYIDHVPLIFRPLDFTGANLWETWVERVFPEDYFTLKLPQTSATRAAQVLAAEGCGTGVDPINILGVWDGPPAAGGSTGTGTNWWTPAIGTIFTENFNSYIAGNDLNGQGPWTDITGTGEMRVAATGAFGDANYLNHIDNGVGGPPRFTYYEAPIGSPPAGFTLQWKTSLGAHTAGSYFGIRMGSHATNYFLVGLENGAITNSIRIDLGGTVYNRDLLTAPVGQHTIRIEYLATSIFRVYEDDVLRFEATPPNVTADVIRLVGNAMDPTPSGAPMGSLDLIQAPGYSSYFDPLTSILYLNSVLPDLAARWISYQYAALAVHLDQVPARIEGGWVNKYRYNFQLEGM